jgi:hypothetical protein
MQMGDPPTIGELKPAQSRTQVAEQVAVNASASPADIISSSHGALDGRMQKWHSGPSRPNPHPKRGGLGVGAVWRTPRASTSTSSSAAVAMTDRTGGERLVQSG